MDAQKPEGGMAAEIALEVIIVITKDNKCMVNGPINNKVLMYGVLEMAKDAVRQFHQEQRVKPASILEMPPGFKS